MLNQHKMQNISKMQISAKHKIHNKISKQQSIQPIGNPKEVLEDKAIANCYRNAHAPKTTHCRGQNLLLYHHNREEAKCNTAHTTKELLLYHHNREEAKCNTARTTIEETNR